MKTKIALVMTMIFAASPLYGEDVTPPPIPSEEQPEVLTRGPVHEAFAEPVELKTQEAVVAPTQPPANITENPPAERPAGSQYVWVPGYWAWDSERNGYIWVSGCWRAAPPSRYWVPGYWSRTDMGWEWIPGFWASTSNVQQIEYLPAPPAIANLEPPGPPPIDDNIWVPPCWYWYGGSYVWRPGYWIVAQEGWVWAPSHYCSTPRGYVFVGGHWDYSLRRRGVLFAPVYFPRHYYERPGFSYSLSVVVDIGNLEFGLFTYPRYCHYYFGDYYDNFYVGIGIFPWYECRSHHSWYDPIYEHNRWRHHRDNHDWDNHERQEYEHRRDNKDLRPPRTYREMEQREARLPEAKRKDIRMAESFDRVVADKKSTMKFEPMKADARQKISKESTDLRKFSDERSRWESSKAPAKSAQPNIERKGPSTQPTERKESATPPPERKGSIAPPTERKEPVTTQMERKGSVTPPAERKESVTPPTERKESATQPPQQKGQAAPSTEPRRQEKATQSEQVKIPPPPIVGKKEGVFRKVTPSQPAEERKTDAAKTPRSDNSPKDTPKSGDSSRDKGQQKGDRDRGK